MRHGSSLASALFSLSLIAVTLGCIPLLRTNAVSKTASGRIKMCPNMCLWTESFGILFDKTEFFLIKNVNKPTRNASHQGRLMRPDDEGGSGNTCIYQRAAAESASRTEARNDIATCFY
jgi:hypothetical protein